MTVVSDCLGGHSKGWKLSEVTGYGHAIMAHDPASLSSLGPDRGLLRFRSVNTDVFHFPSFIE